MDISACSAWQSYCGPVLEEVKMTAFEYIALGAVFTIERSLFSIAARRMMREGILR